MNFSASKAAPEKETISAPSKIMYATTGALAPFYDIDMSRVRLQNLSDLGQKF